MVIAYTLVQYLRVCISKSQSLEFNNSILLYHYYYTVTMVTEQNFKRITMTTDILFKVSLTIIITVRPAPECIFNIKTLDKEGN